MSTPNVDIASRIRQAREEIGLSARAISVKYGVTAKSWLRWETGESSIPSSVIYFLNREFGVSPDWLIAGEGKMVRAEAPQNSRLLRLQIEIATMFDDFWRDLDMRREAALPLFVARYNSGEIKQVPGIEQITESDVYQWLRIDQNPGDLPSALNTDFVTVPLHDVQGSCGDGSVIHSEQIVDYLAFKHDWVSRVATDPKRLALIEAAGDSMMPTINSGDLLLLDLCISSVKQDAIYAINVGGELFVKRIQKRLDDTVIVKSDNPNYEEQRFTLEEASQLRIVGRVIWMGKRI